MVLNYIWIGFFAIAFLIAAVQLMLGNTDVFPAIMNRACSRSGWAL